jgi:hypothetical protein
MEKKRTSAQMARLVTQWRQSGESQASFARRHRIPGWTFWYWCRKLSDEPRPEVAGAAVFVPVRVAADPLAPVLEIMLNTGDRLHVSAGATADLVQAVVTALRSRC